MAQLILIQFKRLGFVAVLLGMIPVVGLAAVQDNQDVEAKKIPEPEAVTVVTSDQVELHAHWYPGTNGKNTVPIILLHGWNSSRRPLLPLAKYLQEEMGHSVMVPDLRGHGESLRVKSVAESLERSRFKKAEIATIVNDIEACKKFLVKKNNQGELNVNLLTVIAVGETCIHAVAWSVDDWKWPPLGGIQQGQDVKAVVMISPRRSFNGLSMTQNLKAPIFSGRGVKPLSVLLVWGARDGQSDREGWEIYDTLKKNRPEVEDAETEEERWKKRDLFRVSYEVGAAGERFVSDPKALAQLKSHLAAFIDKKVVANKDEFRWENRQRD